MRIAGVLASAAGHGALIWVAVTVSPWLRPRPGAAVPVVEVSLVSETAFAAAVAALSRPAAPAPPVPDAATIFPPAPAPAALPALEPAPEPEPEPEISLAPGFDPAAPLGLPAVEGAERQAATVPDLRGAMAPPPARPPASATPSAAAMPADLGTTDYGQAVRAAIVEARADPAAARVPDIDGEARISVIVARDGRLISARLVRPSGNAALDRAALVAARKARLPAAPADLAGRSFTFEVDVVFGTD